jgi:hypothetical protein
MAGKRKPLYIRNIEYMYWNIGVTAYERILADK